MAKGKEAAAAARRRYEAAIEHLDRVTSEVVELKLRTKACETDAARVPGLLKQIEHMQALIDTGSSDELERLRVVTDKRIAEAEATNDELRAFFARVMKRVAGTDIACFAEEDVLFMAEHQISDGLVTGANRFRRRAQANRRTAAKEIVRQDNRRRADENLRNAAGGRGVVESR